MNGTLRIRVAVFLGTVCLAIMLVLPNFSTFKDSLIVSLFGDNTVKLGLDLQGGVYLLLGVEVKEAVQSNLSQHIQELRSSLRAKSIVVSRPLNTEAGAKVTLISTSKQELFLKELATNFPDITVQEETRNANAITYLLAYTEKKQQEISAFALEQAIRTIRNRVDQFGVSEPDIRTQANYRIQIQLPGLQDTKRAINLIGQTAQLTFHVVEEGISPQDSMLPNGITVLPLLSHEGSSTKIAVRTTKEMTGNVIADARPTFDAQGQPDVTLVFTAEGTKLFEQVTSENVGKRLAIVLDGTVYSAPVIREAIGGGRASISGNFSLQEAQDLAITLRAGSLPAPVVLLEERTVGPALGAESIEQGVRASAIAGAIVILFMITYYGWSGVVAACMTVLTLLFLFVELGLLGATLTLPGIAGIVLVLGMAVDANVLIYERIREELRNGATVALAVETGFTKATSAIMDSNITTLLTAAILYQLGTGPIKGFAVTLSMGIVASMFTSIYLSKTCFLFWLRKPRTTITI